ncbi:MAG TPA: FecR family protein, partial [Cellvibrionaceae bacterium]|nr:FecR family protein [Cellvibrionaceae bacterium]
MTQFVRKLSLALTTCRQGALKSGYIGVAFGWLIISSAQAEEGKRCSEYAARLDSLEGKVQWQIGGESQWQAASLNQTFCYGDIIRVDEKRAALRLSNNTLVRLNEHSSIKLIPPTQSFWVELIDGAAHFLTRTPKSFTVKAPYVNAAVEGTEFLVSAHNGVNQVGVIEGVVRSGNSAGSVVLTQGMSTQTTSAEQAPGAPVQLKLNDFVNWAMYFPPLPNRLNVPADIKSLLEQGQDGEVITRINQDAQASAEILSLGAALALNRGQIPAAEALVQRAFKLN